MLGRSWAVGSSEPATGSARALARVAGVLARIHQLPLRARVLAALLTVIAVAETVLVVSFYNQQRQHSITEELVMVAQRMHEIGDFQFAVAQLALQNAPASTQEIANLRATLAPFDATVPEGSAAERIAARSLSPDFAALLRTRAQFDVLRRGSPARAADRTLMVSEARTLTAITEKVHNAADASVRVAQARAHAREADAFRTLLIGSGLSLTAAIGLALLLAGTITRPVARLAAAARALGAGHLEYRLRVKTQDEIGIVSTEFNRMAAQLQDASAMLEERVRTRTEQLADANRQLDLHRIEQERLAQERRTLLGRVITAQEEERRRIARELHDETGQSLTALSLGLEAATEQLGGGQAEQADARLAGLVKVASDASRELERLVLDLRPAQLDRLGLVATLRWYVGRLQTQSSLAIEFLVRGQGRRLPAEIETTLFRLAQEALTNVIRHARADHVSIVLGFEQDSIHLEVSDDGVGFDAPHVSRLPSSIGLIGMRERAQLIGGSVAVQSVPGSGTHITVTVPLESEQS